MVCGCRVSVRPLARLSWWCFAEVRLGRDDTVFRIGRECARSLPFCDGFVQAHHCWLVQVCSSSSHWEGSPLPPLTQHPRSGGSSNLSCPQRPRFALNLQHVQSAHCSRHCLLGFRANRSACGREVLVVAYAVGVLGMCCTPAWTLRRTLLSYL